MPASSSIYPDRSSPSPYGQSAGANANSWVEVGKVYKGYITECNPSKWSYSVTVNDPEGQVMEGCLFAPMILSNLLGYRINYRIPKGTKVLAVGGYPGSIIGCLPSGEVPDGAERSATGSLFPEAYAGFDDNPEANNGKSYDEASDLVDGEFEIANLMGPMIAFLTNMVKIQAGERAKIECQLLRDMVQIVSRQFSHLTAFGTFKVVDDGGRVSIVQEGSQYDYEVWGALSAKSPKAVVSNNVIDKASIAETGRWRLRQYMGMLGDLINRFVTEPERLIGRTAQESIGKSRYYEGTDGTILIQSTTEIALERVTRVQVPVQLRETDDPEGNRPSDFDNLNSRFLKLWDYGTDMENMPLTCFQLREYARFLSQFQSLARVHQLDKDWRVPSEAESVAPSPGNQEEDRESANTGVRYIECYSTIRIMRDGGTVIYDAYGNTHCTGRHGIHSSTTRDYVIEAAGDVRIVAGRNLYVMARLNIEIAAILGGLITKSRTCWRALCEWGSLYLKSDADPANPKTVNDQPNPATDPAPEVFDRAVQVDAPNGNIAVQAKTNITVSSETTDVFVQAVNAENGGVFLSAGQKGIGLNSQQGNVGIQADSTVINSPTSVLVDTAVFDVSRGLTFRRSQGDRGNVLNVNDIRSRRVCAPLIYGRQVGPRPIEDGVDPGKPHYNHVLIFQDNADFNPLLITSDELTPSKDFRDGIYNTIRNGLGRNPLSAKSLWSFFNQGRYIPQDRPLFQTLSQQWLADSNPGADAYIDWDWSAMNGLQPAPRTRTDDAPFVGRRSLHTLQGSVSVGPLNTPTNISPKELDNEQTALQKNQNIVFRAASS